MTNKKLKLAAMSVALTACVAAQPMAAHAVEGPDSVEDNAAPQAEPVVESSTPAPVAEEGEKQEEAGEQEEFTPPDERPQKARSRAKRKSRKSLFPRRTMRPRKMIRLPRSAPAPRPMTSSLTINLLRSRKSPANPVRTAKPTALRAPARRTRLRTPTAPM